MKTGIDILFQEPTCQTRRLRRSVVIESSSENFSIRFVADPFAFEVDQEVLMYFSGKTEFMQQIGCVKEIVEAEEGSDERPLFLIEPIGDEISAESRQNYRVSTLSADLEARVDLSVQDLSSSGFAVVASAEYQIGQTIEVSIAHGEDECHGIASVQSIRSLNSDRIRYGLRAIEEDPHTGQFLQVLQRISLAVQREQLQRSGGAA
jgi:hypothetical protein